jgi:hypothetical protein
MDNAGTEMLKRLAFAFIFSVVIMIQYYSRITHLQSPHHRRSILDIFKQKHYYVPQALQLKKFVHPIKCKFHMILRTKERLFKTECINIFFFLVQTASVCCYVTADWFVCCSS